jgi:hypothetical protein
MYNYSNHLYGMHPVVYSSLKGYDFETVYTTMSSENNILTRNLTVISILHVLICCLFKIIFVSSYNYFK